MGFMERPKFKNIFKIRNFIDSFTRLMFYKTETVNF